MLTIQKFAKLCHCSTQTLRYYDRISLLKPDFVMENNHYRLYAPEQAVAFFEIKELQKLGFSIRDIKTLRADEKDILAEIKKKVLEQRNMLLEAEERLKTFEQRRANVEKEIICFSKQLPQAVIEKKKKIVIQNHDEKVTIEVTKGEQILCKLFSDIINSPIIGIDEEDFQQLSNRIWQLCADVHQWDNIETFARQIPMYSSQVCTHVRHFFAMPQDVSIYDINDCMEAVREKGIYSDNDYFFIGLSQDGQRHYGCLIS